MKKRIAVFLLLVFLGYLAFYISRHYKDFQPLLDVHPVYLLLVAAGHLLVIYMNGLFIKFIMEPFGKTITPAQSFFVSLISTIGNYFLPVGTGTGVKAVYLKKKFKLTYTDFMSTLSGNYIVVFLLNSFVGLAALFALREYAPGEQFAVLSIILSLIFVGMLYMAAFGFPSWVVAKLQNTKSLKKYLGIVSNILSGWNIISRNRKLLVRLIALTLMNLVISAAITYVAITALGLDIKLSALLLYSAITSLSLLLNLTPGSIGIRETIFVLLSATLGLSIPQILSVAIIEKGVLFFVLLVAWAVVQISGTKKDPILTSQGST